MCTDKYFKKLELSHLPIFWYKALTVQYTESQIITIHKFLKKLVKLAAIHFSFYHQSLGYALLHH